MKITGVIPSRYSSTRLPGKPLLMIKGKPMIQRVCEQVLKSRYIDEVIVATDDKRIYDCVKCFGGNAVMTSRHHQSGTDRIFEAIKNRKCDLVVNIQGDEPFIDPGNIDKAISPFFTDKSVNVSTLAVRIKDLADVLDENKVKVVIDKKGYAIYFSRNFIPYDMRHNPGQSWSLDGIKYYKHIGLYVFRKKYITRFAGMKKSPLETAERLEQLRIIENCEKIKVVITKKDSFSVDTMEDLKLANNL